MIVKKSKIFLIITCTAIMLNVMQCIAMQIVLQTLTRKTIAIEIQETDTIWQLKEKIAEKNIEYPTHAQRIIFMGKQLDNAKTLGELNVQKEGILHLISMMGCAGSDVKPEEKIKEASENASKVEGGSLEEKIIQLSETLTQLKSRLIFLQKNIISLRNKLEGKVESKIYARPDQIALVTKNLTDINGDNVITTDQRSVVLSDIIVNCNAYKEDETLKQLMKDVALQALKNNQVTINNNLPEHEGYLATFMEFLKELKRCSVINTDEIDAKKAKGNLNKKFNDFINEVTQE